MRVFVTPVLVEGRVPVYDNAPAPRICDNEQYILVFENGNTTIKVFKELYLRNEDAYFCVQNMEHFISKMRLFKSLDFIELGGAAGRPSNDKPRESVPGKRTSKREDTYRGIEARLRKCKGCPAGVTERGVEISFRPEIYDSVKTSLKMPLAYKSGEQACHRIYRALAEEPLGYDALLEAVGDAGAEETLKSMLFAGIIRQKNDCFCLNETIG